EKIDQKGNFGVGVNQGEIGGNAKIGGVINEAQQPTLAKAAQEIQNLLKQLEQDNPTASETEKIDYINDETSKGFKKRAVAALMGGGETAIEEFLDNPYVNIGKAVVKGWMNPE
ncbi:hypothetical protein, partial [Crocosphaera sp. Alani8]|uniref:hypothetical protein n=1 Tax=Crocosphaera sp. Alani8 TaxID=3038952 RepID=UPI00313AD911